MEGTRPEEIGGTSLQDSDVNLSKKRKKLTSLPEKKTIGIFAAILAVTVLVSVLVTYSLTLNTYFKKESDAVYRLRILSELIESEAYFSSDSEKMINAALKSYVSSMNDAYAVYYDQGEFDRLNEEINGVYVGIGVSFQLSEIELEGKKRMAVEIVGVTKGSSAEAAGLLVGDYILAVMGESGDISVDGLESDAIVSLIRGKEGTTVTITVLRRMGNEEMIKQYTLKRVSVASASVSCKVSGQVGIVRISGFDMQTPTQLADAMDGLIAEGIGKFVIDLRSNPGGDLSSVIACASYFLEENDVILSKEYKNGDSVVYRAVKRSGTCPVSEEDIGKYRGYEYMILTNGATASASEILAAVFRDYSLGTIVGKKTYGKGIVQTIYSLNEFGGVKFTTSLYYPPCGVCYHGIGIEPDVEVSNTETEDLQIKAALELLNQ